MHESKLLKILKTLSEEEIRRFHKFIRSPYYSYKKHCVPFFEYVRKYHPGYTSGKLSKENVFHHLFPERQFQSQKMRHVMTDLVNLLEEFLVAEQVQKRDFERKKLLRDAYGQRDLYEYFEKSTEEITKELEALPYRNSFYQYESMKNLDQFFFHPSTKKHLVKENFLENISKHLDHFFNLSKLHLGTEMKARSTILSKGYDTSFIEELVPKARIHKDIIEYDLYLKACKLYDENSHESYQLLKHSFEKAVQKLSIHEKENIFYILLNFTIRQGNAGNQEFLRESFALYQLALSENIIFKDDQILDANFTNICAAGIKVEEFDWVREFIEKYSQYLPDKMRQNARILCLAFLHYAEGDFEKTDELISNFQFTDTFYLLRGRTLSLRALYELFSTDNSYYDLLISNSLSFEKYLRRNAVIGANHQKVYLSFIQNVKQLSNLIANRKDTPTRIENLYNRVKEAPLVLNRDWILKKIEEVK